jgi:hypothetical protein
VVANPAKIITRFSRAISPILSAFHRHHRRLPSASMSGSAMTGHNHCVDLPVVVGAEQVLLRDARIESELIRSPTIHRDTRNCLEQRRMIPIGPLRFHTR